METIAPANASARKSNAAWTLIDSDSGDASGAGIPAQYPRLGGQHAEYVEAQLTTFRSGARTNSPQMMDIAGRMSDAEIKAVSDYVAGLH